MKKGETKLVVHDGGLTTSSPNTLPIPDKSRTMTVGGAMQTHSSLFERVAPLVRVAAAAIPGVTGAFVARDGSDFVITGPEWDEKLSRAGAALCVAILEELQPSEGEWIHGSYSERAEELPPNYEWVFPKR